MQTHNVAVSSSTTITPLWLHPYCSLKHQTTISIWLYLGQVYWVVRSCLKRFPVHSCLNGVWGSDVTLETQHMKHSSSDLRGLMRSGKVIPESAHHWQSRVKVGASSVTSGWLQWRRNGQLKGSGLLRCFAGTSRRRRKTWMLRLSSTHCWAGYRVWMDAWQPSPALQSLCTASFTVMPTNAFNPWSNLVGLESQLKAAEN